MVHVLFIYICTAKWDSDLTDMRSSSDQTKSKLLADGPAAHTYWRSSMLKVMLNTLNVVAQEDLDEEECPEGFKLSGAVPEAQPDSEAPQGATASRHPCLPILLLTACIVNT